MVASLTIVSGGQTGIDRGALEGARAAGLATGGWCPRGRRAEDGPIPEQFGLQETGRDDYATRTRWNVRDSDGTLLVGFGPLTGGSALTAAACRALGRPLLVLDAERGGPEADPFRADDLADAPADRQAEPLAEQLDDTLAFIAAHRIEVLNVAGPRESEAPGARVWARRFVARLAAALATRSTQGST